MDVPEGSGETAPSLVFGPFTKKDSSQLISRLGKAAVVNQVSKHGLGFQSRRLDQRLIAAVDFQRAKKI